MSIFYRIDAPEPSRSAGSAVRPVGAGSALRALALAALVVGAALVVAVAAALAAARPLAVLLASSRLGRPLGRAGRGFRGGGTGGVRRGSRSSTFACGT